MSESAYLDELLASNPNLTALILSMQDLHKRRLWHQLTGKCIEFVSTPQARQLVDLSQFYTKFVSSFAAKINQVSLVQIAIRVASQLQDKKQQIKHLEEVSELPKVASNSEASILLCSTLSELHVVTNNLEESLKQLEKAKKKMEVSLGIDANIQGTYHRSWAAYYKVKNEPEEFYRSALQYIGYIPASELSDEEGANIAFDLGISALIASKIYNFGDLMEQEILQKLENTNRSWILKVLSAFNRGDIAEWKKLQNQFTAELNNQQALLLKKELLDQKISILALMEMVFAKPSDDRIVSFSAISKATELPLDKVELLVIRGIALGLIKAQIDQASEQVDITWVQPRILEMSQIQNLSSRVKEWTNKVKTSMEIMEQHLTPEVITDNLYAM